MVNLKEDDLFGEFARLQIGSKWYLISDFLNWREILKVKFDTGHWVALQLAPEIRRQNHVSYRKLHNGRLVRGREEITCALCESMSILGV